MLSREDVICCFLYLLGRTPENESVIQHHRNFGSVSELRQVLIGSREFLANTQLCTAGRHLFSREGVVDVDASAARTEEIFSSTGEAWSTLGKTEPHYSVLTVDAYKAENIDQTRQDFYESGLVELNKIKACFSRNRQDMSKVLSALDFGCGLGRITYKVATEIELVFGVDVSLSHLEHARSYAEMEKVCNVKFIHIDALKKMDELPCVDLVYSLIVLQHNTPPVIKKIVDGLASRVSVGGFIYFQVPTFLANYSFELDGYVPHRDRIFEMHVLPQRDVFEVLGRRGFQLLEVMEDGACTDPNFISTTFFAKRAQ